VAHAPGEPENAGLHLRHRGDGAGNLPEAGRTPAGPRPGAVPARGAHGHGRHPRVDPEHDPEADSPDAQGVYRGLLGSAGSTGPSETYRFNRGPRTVRTPCTRPDLTFAHPTGSFPVLREAGGRP